MRRALTAVCLFLSLTPAYALWTATPAAAQQVRIPGAAIPAADEVAQVLRQGTKLEEEDRWPDALAHYEQALKSHPGEQKIQSRIKIVRRHYNLARRYADSSFVRSLSSLNEPRALDLYTQMLNKIRTHYVKAPNWRDLVQEGLYHFQTALSSKHFVRQNMPSISDRAIETFRADLRSKMSGRYVRNVNEARTAVAIAARLGQQQVGIPTSATVLEFVAGAAGALDDYSSFLTPDQYDDVMSQIEGNFVGLGIELKPDRGTLRILNVIRGGPAAAAGIQAGERIVKVNGLATEETTADKAADMLRGPDGSSVELGVASTTNSVRVVRLVRRRIDVPSIEDAKLLDPQAGIAYLRLATFQKTTGRDLDAALWKLHRQGMRKLILDVRGNPGGLLPASVDVADRFLKQGIIVSTRGRNSREDFDYRARSVGTWRLPLYVLIDGDSASASEIFAGAIRDHGRGTVIGQKSYGKGSVQGIFSLRTAGMGVRLTTAKFYSPSGRAISKNGVLPHITVRLAAKPVTNGSADQAKPKDEVLEQALQLAQRR